MAKTLNGRMSIYGYARSRGADRKVIRRKVRDGVSS
jgi:hypothetical protein